MANAKKHRKKYIAAKVEAAKGTAEALGNSDYAILAFDPVIDDDIELNDRAPAGVAMGTLQQIPGTFGGRFRGRVELRGSGAAGTLPLWASTLLLACGLENTNSAGVSDTMTQVSSMADESCVTIGLWEDGKFKSIRGAMGNARIEGDVGRTCFVDFDFVGIWVTPTDVAAPSITHETTVPARFANATLTLGSFTPGISRASLDLGNDVQLRPDLGDISGLGHAYIADRRPKLSLDPEALSVADKDLFGELIAATQAALTWVIGSVAGNIMTITAPKAQWASPRSNNRNGLQAYDVDMMLNENAGDDSVQIVFT